MNWRGRFTLAFVLLAIAVGFTAATWTGAAPRAGTNLPEYTMAGKDPQLLGLTGSSKRPDGMPVNLGPAIVDVVLWTGGSGNLAEHILWLVFNGDVTAASFRPDDLEFRIAGGLPQTFNGLSFAYHEANTVAPTTGLYGNVIEVTGLDNLPGALTLADRVNLRNPRRLGFKDASVMPIKFGPAITKAVVSAGGADAGVTDNTGDEITVYFTHQITTGVSTANARLDFTFPELNLTGSPGATPTTTFTTNDRFVTIQMTDNDYQGKIREGITAVRFASNGVITGRRNGTFTAAEQSGAPRWHLTENEGPRLLRAGYNAVTNQVTLAFSDDVQADVIVAPGAGVFSITGGFTYASVVSDDGDNVLRLSGLSGDPTGSTVDIATTASVLDYQNNASVAGGIPIVASPIITLAQYRDGGTPGAADLADDRLNVWFDVDFSTAPGAANFGFRGLDNPTLAVNLPATGNQISLQSLGELWTQGDRIFLTETSIAYVGGANATPDTTHAWIRDGVAPKALALATNPAFTSDIEDTAYVGFDEAGTGDDAAYVLFYARRDLPIDDAYIADFVEFATPITDPSIGLNNIDSNSSLVATFVIDPTAQDTQGEDLAAGVDVYFAAIALDAEGNWNPANFTPLGLLVAGPLAAPRDTLVTDDNLIHVFGVSPTSEGPYDLDVHYVCADPGSAPPDADSVRVYADAGRVILLGSGAVSTTAGSEGAFGPIELDPIVSEPGAGFPWLYLVSVQNTGASAIESFGQTMIRNDNNPPVVDAIFDPINTLQCYSGGDSLRILTQLFDPTNLLNTDGETIGVDDVAINPLLHVWADLSNYVTTAGYDSLVLHSLGANQVDDDNDWIDVGLVDPAFTANGTRDWPEPYVDENGDGAFTPGETFVDLPLTGYTAGIYDAGDLNLDMNDSDEAGWYYLPGKVLNTADLVADPEGVVNFAVLEDLAVILHVEDSAVRSDLEDNVNFGGSFGPMMTAITGGTTNLVNPLGTICPSYSLEHREIFDDLFLGKLDSQAPSVSEISFLERQAGNTTASGNPADNIIIPGDHAYTIAAGEASPYFNIADSTLSDDDVTLVALQINNGAGWSYLSFDPAGDANGDGAPGILDYDDDGDTFVDLEDPQVRDAAQDSTADANAEADGIYILTDRRDNDNDAFFRYNPITGGYVWFNVDERPDNQIDDDGNGVIDDGSEVETYIAANDDDEDGIMNGSAVGIAVSAGQLMSSLGYSGNIYVRGFEDPATIAKYSGTPTKASPDLLHNPSGFASWPNDLVSAATLLVQGAKEFYPNKYEILSGTLMGRDDLAAVSFAKGAPNVISAAGQTNTPGLAPWVTLTNATTAFAFDYREQNGRNLNMRVIKSLYGIVDGVEFQVRAVAFDQCYQGNPNWAVPLRLKTDSTVGAADIPSDIFGADEICDVIQTDNDNDGLLDPQVYTLDAAVAGDIADIAFVEFQIWDPDTEVWTALGTDSSPPFTHDWSYPEGLSDGSLTNPLTNNPPAFRDTVWFRAVAADQFGNYEEDVLCDSLFTETGTACYEVQAIVTDCTSPMSCLCQIGSDYDPSDGAFVPVESAIDISAWFTDGDGDSTTNDVVRVLFEYRPVGTQDWLELTSLTGVDASGDSLVDVTGIKHPIIFAGPDTFKVTVTWDTRGLATGSYDLRAVAFDIEGNSNPNMTCVATATLDDVGLRAYIQPCVKTADVTVDSLFANVYIHDYSVSTVAFQFYEDTDGDGVDNDGNTWVPVNDPVGAGSDPKGDPILRAGLAHIRDLTSATPELLLGGTNDHRFFDVDGDGYNPVDPILFDANSSGTVDVGDALLAGFEAGYTLSDLLGEDLTQFEADEYFTDFDGDAVLDAYEWILKDNPLDGADANIDVWSTAWDVTGLSGCFVLRAVAVDQLGNTDDDENGDGIPDSDPTVIWTETCCIDTDIPTFCVTSYEDATGIVDIAPGPECPWVASQDELTFFATPLAGDGADVDSVWFEYSVDGGVTFEQFGDTDFFAVDGWSAVFPYGEIDFVTDTQVNFRAIAWKNGNRAVDPNQCKVCLVLGENQCPEADIVWIVTAEGDTLDTNTVLRGTTAPYCIEPTQLYMLATAEDNATIETVQIWSRKVAGATSADVTDWAPVAGLEDMDYPYEFIWDISGLTDGVYEFFPRAYDTNGNFCDEFGNPFYFSMSTQSAVVTAAEKNGIAAESLTPGEEVVVKGEIAPDPADNVGVAVKFYYAERIEGETISVSSTPPYTADTDYTIYSNSMAGMAGSEVVYVDDVVATYVAGTPTTNLEYTISGSDELTFGAAMTSGAVVSIDYNVTVCKAINLGDDDSPYSVAWDADSNNGLVPIKSYADVTHFDLIATASRTFTTEDGDTYEACEEDCHSDGFALPIADTEAPEFLIHGLLCETLFTLDAVLGNAPGNPLCQTCGGNDAVGDFGDCKCKLSGIEHQLFVTGDDDITGVMMSVGGNAPVDFAFYDEDSVSIEIPITFYIDDLADVLANGFEGKAVNPDSVENVTITIEGIGAINVAMTDMGDGVYQYIADLPIGGTYEYAFSVDFVGDDQVTDIDDPRWGHSVITIPGEFWCYDISDPATFWGMHELNQVTFTVTDGDGNVSNNLMSGGFSGAAGQIWVTYDPTPAVVASFWANVEKVGPGGEVQMFVTVPDPVPGSTDIIQLDGVIFQASVDDTGERWRTIYSDFTDQDFSGNWTEDGGWGGYFDLPRWMNPYTDGIDNDRDGFTDENDTELVGNGVSEKTYTYALRVVTVDDCFNYGYSCGHPRAQDPEVCGAITVDADLPQACLTSPEDGALYAIGDVVTLVASTEDDDVAYVRFEYTVDNGNSWNTIDPTPLNDDDDPWVYVANEDGTYSCSWDTGFLAREVASDFYVGLRSVAVDMVDNEQSDDSELDCDINIILNDTTGPLAVITLFEADCFQDPKRPFDPTLALSGDVYVTGRAYGWNSYDVATVTVEVSADGTNWDILGIDNEFRSGSEAAENIGAQFSVHWDTDLYAEGTWFLRAYATDADGNVTNDADGNGVADELVELSVVIDHTAPDFMLTRVGPEGVFGTTLDAGDLVRPDLLDEEIELCTELSDDVTFWASAQDVAGDVEAVNSVGLEFLDDVTDPENPTWRGLDGFEYRDASGDDQNPDGNWVLVYDIDDLYEDMEDAVPGDDLPAKEYFFRVRAVDYACNSNDDSEGILLRIDHIYPDVRYLYAGDSEFEAGAGTMTVHVAGGDTVPLAARVNDTFGEDYPDGGSFDSHLIHHESSGIYAVQFGYLDGNDNLIVIGLGTYDDGGTAGDDPEDTADDLWKIDWTTPANMAGSTDTLYTVTVVVRDNAGNCDEEEFEDAVAVQDVTPPSDTKLIAVVGESCDDDSGNTYPWTYINEDEGDDGPFDDGEMGIDEAVLSQDLSGTTPLGTVARWVDLHAATPQGDASMLGSGIYDATVFFEARRVDAGKAGLADGWTVIGEGECWYNCGEIEAERNNGVLDAAISYRGPIFSLSWDTKQTAPDGSYVWFDENAEFTSVQIRVRARDVWGNEEIVVDDAVYHLHVDNVAPKMAVKVTDLAGNTITSAERNDLDGVMIMATGGGSDFVNDDLVVNFEYKLASDLNEDGSWHTIHDYHGVAPANDNPDHTRPYVFHWNTNAFRDHDGDPLIPNEDYDISVEVYDLVCNATNVVQHYEAGGFATLEFVDTIAPMASITHIARDYEGAYCDAGVLDDEGFVENPEGERVNGLDQVWARILDGATDTQDVKFYFRAAGTSAWTLADADIDSKELDDIQTWVLYNWSTAPLAEGAWEMAAVATDDAGNTDADPAVMSFIIDRVGPDFAAVTPVDDQIIVPENVVDRDGPDPVTTPLSKNGVDMKFDVGGLGASECNPDRRVADLIVTSDDADILYENSWNNCVSWEWKRSAMEDVDSNWNSVNTMVLYDGFTNRFSGTVVLEDNGTALYSDGLYDWRVSATDEAGNFTRTVVAEKTVVDNTAPDLEITHFHIDGHETTIDPIDNGQITDVSHGESILIYATVSDDEVNIPASHETDVVEVQFFVRHIEDNEWTFIGTAGYDEALGLWGVTWNTTGLTSTGNDFDQYVVTAFATDEAANCGEAHSAVVVDVENHAVPLAQITAFNPDLLSVITKGTNDRVYGLTFGEKEANTVFFQYRPVGTSEWTTVGVSQFTGETLTTRQASLIDQDLWYAQLRTSDWADGSLIEFRAVATDGLTNGTTTLSTSIPLKGGAPGQGGATPLDGDPNIFSGLYDLANTPTLVARVNRTDDGGTTLEPTDDLGYLESVKYIGTGHIKDGRIEVNTSDRNLAPFVVVVAEDGDGSIDEYIPELDRMIDDRSIWVGEHMNNVTDFTSIDPTGGATLTIFASAHLKRTSPEDPAPRTEMAYTRLMFHQVDQNRGSNGVAGIDGNGSPAADGYPTDTFAVRIPANAVSSKVGMLVRYVDMPNTPAYLEDVYETIGDQAYVVSFHNSSFAIPTTALKDGYEADVWARYDEANLFDAAGEPIDESTLTLRAWDEDTGESGWETEGLSEIRVDTDANVIRAKMHYGSGGPTTGGMLLAVVSVENEPFTFEVSPDWNGWTDQDPIIKGLIDLRNEDFRYDSDGESDIDVIFYIDDKIMYSSGSGGDEWYRYFGSNFYLWDLGDGGGAQEGMAGWEYQHTCDNADALKEGLHTARIQVYLDDPLQPVSSQDFEFWVDRTAPYVEFHGGYVGSPELGFAAGYIDLDQDILSVKLFDAGSGILFSEDRIDDYETLFVDDQCALPGVLGLCELIQETLIPLDPIWDVYCYGNQQGDGSFKYDVWVITPSADGGADQTDIDEFEERTLIYTGTADALAPYVTPGLGEYVAATDTLNVPLAVLTGGELIEDGSVIEITLYSHRIIMVGGEISGGGSADLGSLEDLLGGMGINLRLNSRSEEYVAYVRGPMDNVFNAGSRFVEQRFIVDQSAPEVMATSAGVVCGGASPTDAIAQMPSYTFTASFVDDGVGVDLSTVTVNVSGPNGEPAVANLNITNSGMSMVISNPDGGMLAVGNYVVTISGEDKLGNEFGSVCTFVVGSNVVQVTAPKVFPNPVNPAAGNASISFELPKSAEVTVTAYDWSGDYVATVFKGQLPVGPQNIQWGAQAEDGTPLANGVYLLRIVADDGARQEPKVVKVAIWNER